jgi:hypothetical protein
MVAVTIFETQAYREEERGMKRLRYGPYILQCCVWWLLRGRCDKKISSLGIVVPPHDSVAYMWGAAELE